MMEGQNMLSWLAVSTWWHKLKKNPPFAVQLDCMVWIWHLVFSCEGPLTKFHGRLSCLCSALTTFGW
jgi:hypothetical protein